MSHDQYICVSKLKYAEKIREAVKARASGLTPSGVEEVREAITIAQEQRDLNESLVQRQADLEGMILRLSKTKGMTAAEMRLKFDAVLTKHDYHPAEELIKMLRETVVVDGREIPLLTPSERIRVHSEILSYCTPRVKSSEITHSLDQTFTVLIREFGAQVSGDEKRVEDAKVLDVEGKQQREEAA